MQDNLTWWRGGVIYQIYDTSGSIKMLLWDSQVSGGSREQLREGAEVTATGKIKVYKNELEIVPQNESDIVLTVTENAGGAD